MMSRPVLAAAALLATICVSTAQAQQSTPESSQVIPQSLTPPYAGYAAKFVCGQGNDQDVVLGRYLTAINIHNPQAQATVKFLKKFVLAKVEGVARGCVVAHNESLTPDRALYVDCPTIISALSGSTACFPGGVPPLIEGFIVLQVAAGAGGQPPLPLDVVGKYTARPNADQVSSIDVVVYQPTQITQ